MGQCFPIQDVWCTQCRIPVSYITLCPLTWQAVPPKWTAPCHPTLLVLWLPLPHRSSHCVVPSCLHFWSEEKFLYHCLSIIDALALNYVSYTQTTHQSPINEAWQLPFLLFHLYTVPLGTVHAYVFLLVGWLVGWLVPKYVRYFFYVNCVATWFTFRNFVRKFYSVLILRFILKNYLEVEARENYARNKLWTRRICTSATFEVERSRFGQITGFFDEKCQPVEFVPALRFWWWDSNDLYEHFITCSLMHV